jgi:hypothetical protein
VCYSGAILSFGEERLSSQRSATEDGKKSPWNSLETAKFVISVCQIIATAAVSIALAMVSLSFQKETRDTNIQEAQRQQKQITADAQQAKIDADRRLEAAKIDADRRADAAKLDADNRDKAAREEVLRRAEQANGEAQAKEDADRRLADENAKFQRVVMKRVSLWSELAPNLNDIYSYLLYVGKWKEFDASVIVKKKRECDKIVYSDRFYLSDDFFSAYDDFMKFSFKTENGLGVDAKPNTTLLGRPAKDEDLISGRDQSEDVHRAYFKLQAVAAYELNLRITPPQLPPPPK